MYLSLLLASLAPTNSSRRPRSKKWATTFALGFVTFCVTFASSVFSPGTLATAQEFNVSDEVMVLGTALFVLGFAFGPVWSSAWCPLRLLLTAARSYGVRLVNSMVVRCRSSLVSSYSEYSRCQWRWRKTSKRSSSAVSYLDSSVARL